VIETCPECSSAPGYQGRYCAPTRCYCGHVQCPAYALGWRDVRSHSEVMDEALSDAASLVRAQLSPDAERAVQRALAHAETAPRSFGAQPKRLVNRQAAERAMPKAGTVMHDVLSALAKAHESGHVGATDAELARFLALPNRSERSAVVRLIASGLAYDSGRTRAHEGADLPVWAPATWALRLLGISQPES
jgi:hypothetical protein